MIVNNQFNRYFWGLVITDIKVNLKYPIKLNHKVFGYVQVDLKRLSKDSIHQLLKLFNNVKQLKMLFGF